MHGQDPLPGSKVLLAGRGDDDREGLAASLVAAGLLVDRCPSGAEVLERAPDLPDLIVIGDELRDMSGVELIAVLKDDPLTLQIPVIQHSAAAAGEDARVEGLTRGADAHLIRPVRPDVLVATARSLLRQRELSQQLELALSLDVTGVYDWAIPSDSVRWTPSLERMYRMEPGSFGGTIADFVASLHPDDRERVGAELAAAIEHDDTIDLSFRFVRADGSVGWMESRGRVFRNRDGEAVRLLGLAHDVSTRVFERGRVEQLRRLAGDLAAARTSAAVMDVVHRELDGSNVEAVLVDADDPPAHDVSFSSPTRERRLDLRVRPTTADHGITTDQSRAIGELAGAALDRAFIYEAERSNAIALQRALLPANLPEIDGWEIDCEYLPATGDDRLGGDFYDVIELGDRFVVVLGDVAGHGLAATTQMGTVRILLRTLAASHAGDLLAVLRSARRLFDDVCGAGSPFVTVVLAVIDHRSGRMALASAGHPAPVVVGDGRPHCVEMTPGPPLGVPAEATETLTQLVVPSGGSVVLYTDGVIETRTEEETRIDVLVDDLGSMPTAHGLIVASHSLDELNLDDRAVVVVRRY